MSAEQNKARAEAAYRAFSEGDGAAAMEHMHDSVKWVVRGENALTGTYLGKEEIGELWAKVGEVGVETEPHDFIADGDKVIVLNTVTLGGECSETADVLSYNDEGKLIQFERIGDPAVGNRVFAR